MNYSYLKVFIYATYTHRNIGKLEPKSLKSVFLGYDECVKRYRLWVKSERGIIGKDVIFNESLMPYLEGK